MVYWNSLIYAFIIALSKMLFRNAGKGTKNSEEDSNSYIVNVFRSTWFDIQLLFSTRRVLYPQPTPFKAKE